MSRIRTTFEPVNSGRVKDSGIHFFNLVKWILIVLVALAVGGALLRRLSQQQAENPRRSNLVGHEVTIPLHDWSEDIRVNGINCHPQSIDLGREYDIRFNHDDHQIIHWKEGNKNYDYHGDVVDVVQFGNPSEPNIQVWMVRN